MSGPRDVESLIGDSGRLVSVAGLLVADSRLAKIALEFANGTLILGCDDTKDEILLQVGGCVPGYAEIGHDLLVGLIGMTATYAWTLTNHRGYRDAFQVRLMASDRSEETRQFEVAASAIDVYRVNDRSAV